MKSSRGVNRTTGTFQSQGDTTELIVANEDPKKVTKSDFSGVWKRVKLVNYENLMAAQGAGYVQRKLAASIAMTHTITMDKALTAFRLQEKGGPLDTDNLYSIDGPELSTTTLKKNFLDKATWDGAKLKIRKLNMPEQNSELVIYRELEDGGKTLKLVVYMFIIFLIY
jgi:hypothetical protein